MMLSLHLKLELVSSFFSGYNRPPLISRHKAVFTYGPESPQRRSHSCSLFLRRLNALIVSGVGQKCLRSECDVESVKRRRLRGSFSPSGEHSQLFLSWQLYEMCFITLLLCCVVCVFSLSRANTQVYIHANRKINEFISLLHLISRDRSL